MEALKADFDENKVPAVLRGADQENIPLDILTTLHRGMGKNLDEVMGEFCILPVNAGDKTLLYFSTLFTLTEDMDPVFAKPVLKAIQVLNFYVECGSFVLSRQGTLLGYRMVTPMMSTWSKERLYETANLNIALALQVTERYVGSLLMLADGRDTLEHFMELMPET